MFIVKAKPVFMTPSKWEKVRTMNFTTSKTKKNIEKVGDDHYIKNGF
jgi:hypothetical protein